MQASDLAHAIAILRGDADLIYKAIEILRKADPGAEPGEFRGGDPQELQEKKEIKRQEMKDSGELEIREEEKELEIEEAGGQSAWEEEQAEQDEMKRAMTTVPSAEVSPVEHSEGYRPRNANGDPIEPTEKKDLPPNIEPAPTRTDKQRYESTWSKFLGMEVPLEGAYWQHMRTLRIRNQESGAIREYDKFLKSFMDRYEDEFFAAYDNLNGGLCFDTTHRILKGYPLAGRVPSKLKGKVYPGHKYIYRYVGKDGSWQYEYTRGVHPNKHGMGNTGSLQGHTVEVHPDWHGGTLDHYDKGNDPKLENPEEAFHFTRQKHLEQGHIARFNFLDKNKPELGVQKKILRIKPPHTKKPIEIHNDIYEDTPVDKINFKKKSTTHRMENLDVFEKHVRHNEVNVEHDVKGKPWIEWYHPQPKQGETASGRVSMRYLPDSEFSRVLRGGKVPVGKYHAGPDSVDSLRKRVRKELHAQKHSVGEAKPFPFEPTGKEHIDMLQRGEIPGKWTEIPFADPAEPSKPSKKYKGTKLGFRRKWDSQDQRTSFYRGVLNEIHDDLGKIIMDSYKDINKKLSRVVNPATGNKDYALRTPQNKEESDNVVKNTKGYAAIAIAHAVESYDPSYPSVDQKTLKKKGFPFSDHLRENVTHILEKNLASITNDVFPMGSSVDTDAYDRIMREREVGRRVGARKTEKALPAPSGGSIDSWASHVVQHLQGHSESGHRHPQATQDTHDHHHEVVSAALKDLEHTMESGGSPASYYVRWTDPLMGGFGFVPPYGKGERYASEEVSKAKKEEPQQENEITPESHPGFFHEDGTMLNQPIPEGIESESNPEYDSDKKQGNFWAKKYQDPDTGDNRYVYFHHDQVGDPRYARNNSLRHVAEQLPKLREWYFGLAQSESQHDQTVGLFLALCDQASLPPEALVANIMVGDVKISGIDTVILTFPHGKVSVVLDSSLKSVLLSLLEGKDSSVHVFAIDEHILDIGTVNQHMQEMFGVTLDDLHVYRCTFLFSKEFQKLIIQEKEDLTDASIQHLRQQALRKVAEFTGQTLGDVDQMVDPIAVEACVLSTSTGRHKVLKAIDILEKAAHKLQGRTEFQGLKISVENKKGSYRYWHDPNAKEGGKTKMHFDYGYIRMTEGVDGDHVDVYLGPDKESNKVYIVHQMKKPGFKEYDEDKVMLAFSSAKEAKAAYLKQYDDPRFFGSMTEMMMDEFKKKVLATRDQPKMIKSQVWVVGLSDQYIDPSEEQFNQWVHSYPLHEHEKHWGALNRKHANQEHRDYGNRPSGIDHELVTPPKEEELAS